MQAAADKAFEMQSLRLDTLAAHVVAWHNRHPLARRITAAQVQGVGWVAVPYVAAVSNSGGAAATHAARPAELAAEAIQQAQSSAAAGTLRERAAARALAAAGVDDAVGEAVAEDSPSASAHESPRESQPESPPKSPATHAPTPATPQAPPKASRKTKLRAAFDEDFIAPISRRAVARFAARFGIVLPGTPTDAPLREVLVARVAAGDRDGDGDGDALTLRYVATAAIEVDATRLRVLIAPAGAAAVIGPRLFDRRRVAGVFGLLAVLAAAALWSIRPTPTLQAPIAIAAPPPAVAVVVAVPVLAPTPAVAAVEPTHAPHDASPATHAEVSAPPPHAAPKAEPVASAPHLPVPVPVPPAVATAPRDLRPQLDEATRAAARAELAALRAARGGTGSASASTAAPTAHAPTPAPADTRVLFALSTRVLRTQAESEQLAAATRALLAGGSQHALKIELLPAGDDWRVVAWPFASAAEAEAARQRLAKRGMRLQVIEF